MRFVAFDTSTQVVRINPEAVFAVLAEPDQQSMRSATWGVVVESVSGAAVVVRSGLDRERAEREVAAITAELVGLARPG